MAMRYFAYGSNIAEGVMSSQCPRSRYLGRAELRDHHLAFTRQSIRTKTGVADVLPCHGQSVWGALYELDEDGLAVLDRKEGHGWAYRRAGVVVYVDGAQPTQAITYRVVEPETAEVPPSKDYIARLIQAARERELPRSYVEHLVGLERRLPRV